MSVLAGLDLRRLLLLIVVLGAFGLVVELLLLDHFEEWTQWLPLAVLGLVLVASAATWRAPAPRTLKLFRAVMLLSIATGVVGIVLHFSGNRAFELEMEPGQGGWLLVWHSLRGATPALAPGAMVQLGLVGLASTWRYPARTGHRSED